MSPHRPRALVLLLALVGGVAACSGPDPVLPVCGNGVIEGREHCDDGNLEAGDGCDQNCLLEARETCDNRVDDDGDGSADCADPDCFSHPACQGQEICSNGWDDDDDGLVDCADPDCLGHAACTSREDCSNGLDDDGDTRIDCEDVDCFGHPDCGGCDPDLDLGDLAPGDDRVLTVDGAGGVSPTGLSCAPLARGAHLRFAVAVGFHLRINATEVLGESFLGLIREELPGESCETDELDCLAITGSPTRWERTNLPPGAYRVVVSGATADASAVMQLRVTLLPASQELCDNGADDDGDGLIDCADPDCGAVPACWVELCDNGADDDGDGLTDCADPDCALAPPCLPPEICGNGLDDDADGHADCADPDCAGTAGCQGSDCVVNVDLGVLSRDASAAGSFDTTLGIDRARASCGLPGPEVVLAFTLSAPASVVISLTQSGDHVLAVAGEGGPGSWCDDAEYLCVDPGGGGRSARLTLPGLPAARYLILVDATGPDRTGTGTVTVEAHDPLHELCDDGLDDDGDGLTDCADPDCVDQAVCRPETSCHDGLDNDADGRVDCADLDCAGSAACSPGACQTDRDLGVVTPGSPALVEVDTSTAVDAFSTGCARLGGGGDVVVAFTLDATGDVLVSGVQLDFSDHAVALANPAGPGSRCDAAVHACTDAGAPGLPLALVVPGVPPGLHYLILEPFGPGSAGRVRISLDVSPP
jgi:cysteine-rich repeat protein